MASPPHDRFRQRRVRRAWPRGSPRAAGLAVVGGVAASASVCGPCRLQSKGTRPAHLCGRCQEGPAAEQQRQGHTLRGFVAGGWLVGWGGSLGGVREARQAGMLGRGTQPARVTAHLMARAAAACRAGGGGGARQRRRQRRVRKQCGQGGGGAEGQQAWRARRSLMQGGSGLDVRAREPGPPAACGPPHPAPRPAGSSPPGGGRRPGPT